MGAHPALVRFADGEVLHACYISSADSLSPSLFATYEEAQAVKGRRWDSTSGEVPEPVEIWTSYAGGFSWNGFATRTAVTDGLVPAGRPAEGWPGFDEIPARPTTPGTPAWAQEAFAEEE